MDSFEQLRRELDFEKVIGVGPQEDYDAEDASYVRNEFNRLFNAKPSLCGLLGAIDAQLQAHLDGPFKRAHAFQPLSPSPAPAPKRGLWGRVKSILNRKA